jgi:hypothetical protein
MRKSLIVIGILVSSLRFAHATATTHIWAPSTDVQAFKKLHLTSDMYLATEQTVSGGRIPTVTNLGLTAGVLPFEKVNAEVGFDHKSGLGQADNYPLYYHLKVGTPEAAWESWSPAIAVGIFDVGTKSDVTDYNVVYGKVAKTIGSGKKSAGRFSLGFFSGNDKLLVNSKGEKDNSGLLAAWERTMPEISDKLWLCVEYMGSESAYGTLNIGGAWKFADNVGALIAYDIFNNSDLADTFTIQIDVDF